jgi:chromate transport protein ChrA
MESSKPSSIEVVGAMIIAFVAYYLLSLFLQNGHLASVLAAAIALLLYCLYTYLKGESFKITNVYASTQNRIFIGLLVVFIVADLILNNPIPYVLVAIAAIVLAKLITLNREQKKPQRKK